MLEIFDPYLPFVITFMIITINVLLVFMKANWFVFIIANVLVITLLGIIGLSTDVNILGDLFSTLINLLGGFIKELFGTLTSCSANK